MSKTYPDCSSCTILGTILGTGGTSTGAGEDDIGAMAMLLAILGFLLICGGGILLAFRFIQWQKEKTKREANKLDREDATMELKEVKAATATGEECSSSSDDEVEGDTQTQRV